MCRKSRTGMRSFLLLVYVLQLKPIASSWRAYLIVRGDVNGVDLCISLSNHSPPVYANGHAPCLPSRKICTSLGDRKGFLGYDVRYLLQRTIWKRDTFNKWFWALMYSVTIFSHTHIIAHQMTFSKNFPIVPHLEMLNLGLASGIKLSQIPPLPHLAHVSLKHVSVSYSCHGTLPLSSSHIRASHIQDGNTT